MKKYVRVIAIFNTDGTIVPRVIMDDDGSHLEINQISEVRRAASLSAGGYGIRYTGICCGRPFQIYREGDRWFVDSNLYYF